MQEKVATDTKERLQQQKRQELSQVPASSMARGRFASQTKIISDSCSSLRKHRLQLRL